MNKDKKHPYILRRGFNFFNEDILPGDIDIQINEPKDTLNRDLWDGMHLKQNVRLAMLKIVKAFKKSLKIDVPIKDVIFTGSMANFNWTLNSDIDIHLILDLTSMDEPEEFVEEYLIAKKTLWNSTHNITIKGFEVELYAKDEETLTSSKGVYSVLKGDWIQKPTRLTEDIDEISIKEKVAGIMNDIDSLDDIPDEQEKMDACEKIKDRIKKMRNSGLEKGGEYSVENLAFKVLRKSEYLDKLWGLHKKMFDDSLTLNEKQIDESIQNKKILLSEGKEGFKKEFGCLMLNLRVKNWDKIVSIVKDEDVYDEPGYGIEENPHITALFGFLPEEVNPKDVETFTLNFFKNKGNVDFSLTELSLFENESFDVLKFDVSSDDLQELNKALTDEFPYENDYPDYHPHTTIAYLKPGKGKKYAKKIKDPIKLSSSQFSYSYPPDEKIEFSLSKKENTLGVEKNIKDMTEEKIDYIKNFINFVCNRLEIQDPVTIFLHKDRDDYIYTTASYAPSENSNHIRCEGRALVDILRSIAHELTHNKQREIQSYKKDEVVQTIGGWIEDEANAKAGVLIKDFAMNFDFDKIYEL